MKIGYAVPTSEVNILLAAHGAECELQLARGGPAHMGSAPTGLVAQLR